MDDLHTNFEKLDQLISKANELITPLSYHHTLKYLTPDFVRRDYKNNKDCYLVLRKENGDVLFPICSICGSNDPNVIKLSMKLANELRNKGRITPDEQNEVVKKLKILYVDIARPMFNEE